MTSIRLTITRNTSAVVFAVVSALCLSGFLLLRDVQVRAFEQAIEDDLRVVANGVKVWPDGDIYLERSPVLLPEFAARGHKAFVVRDATGTAPIGMSQSLIANEAELNAVRGAVPGVTSRLYTLGHNGQPALVATRLLPAQCDWDLDDATIEVPSDVRETQVQITVSTDRTALNAALWTPR